MHLRCRPDHGIWQFDPMASTKANSAFRNLFIDCDDIEAVQKAARRRFKILIGANHDLHPRNDADCFFSVALKFCAGFGNGIEVVDENVGVEQCLHHSRRTFS